MFVSYLMARYKILGVSGKAGILPIIVPNHEEITSVCNVQYRVYRVPKVHKYAMLCGHFCYIFVVWLAMHVTLRFKLVLQTTEGVISNSIEKCLSWSGVGYM